MSLSDESLVEYNEEEESSIEENRGSENEVEVESVDDDDGESTLTTSADLDLQLSGEALDALEESLKQQMEALEKEEQEFEQMFRLALLEF